MEANILTGWKLFPTGNSISRLYSQSFFLPEAESRQLSAKSFSGRESSQLSALSLKLSNRKNASRAIVVSGSLRRLDGSHLRDRLEALSHRNSHNPKANSLLLNAKC
jgi:hypothetical protein